MRRIYFFILLFFVIFQSFFSCDSLNQAADEILNKSVPAVPTNLTVKNPTSSTLLVSWDSVSKATGYQLYRDTNSTGDFSTKVFDNYDASVLDSGLSSNTTYYYRVRSYNANGASSFSQVVGGTTSVASSGPGSGQQAGDLPATPTGITVTNPTTTSLTVSWVTVSNATAYQVFRDTSAGGDFSTELYNGSAVSFIDTGLVSGTTYYYKVRATNAVGSSSLSSAVSGVTNAAPETGISNGDLVGGSNSTKPPELSGWTFGIDGTWDSDDFDANYFATYGGRSGVIWLANNPGGTSGDRVWMEQTFTVPSNAVNLQVNGSNTGFGAYPFQENGTLQVYINGSMVAQQTPQNTTDFTISFDISSYRGQPVTLRIQRPQIGSGYNIVFIDLVTITTE